MRYLLLAILLSGCGGKFVAARPSTTLPEFESFVVMFESDYGHNVDIPIIFAQKDGDVIGACKIWSDGYRAIEIDPDYWNSGITNLHRRALIYHELGHCILDLPHNSNMITYYSSKIPQSFMYPYLMPAFANPDLQDYYVSELFNPTSTVTPAHMQSADGCVVHVD